MDETTTTTTTIIEDPTTDLNAEVTVTFTVTRTYVSGPMTVASIVAELAQVARDQVLATAVQEPNRYDWDLTDPTEYVDGLLEANPYLLAPLFAPWVEDGASIEDEDVAVELVEPVS